MSNQKFLFSNTSGYYEEDKISVSVATGNPAADADSLVKLNAAGKIDPSLMDFGAFRVAFKARVASTADVTIATAPATIDGVTLASGNLILLKDQTIGSENGLYVFNGAGNALTRYAFYDESSEVSASDLILVSEGTTYADIAFVLVTNDPIVLGTTSLTYSPFVGINIIWGRGLSFSGLTAQVNVNDGGAAGLIINSDFVEINWFVPGVDTPSTASRAVKVLDLFANGTDQGANLIGVNNTAFVNTHTHTNNLQTTLAGLDQSIIGQLLNVSANVNAGDLLSVSGSGTVARLNTANAQEGVGLAFTTATTGNPVRVARNGERINGCLSGATPGAVYYWNGTALTATIPTGGGAYVWKAGVAVTATDLLVQMSFLKRNAS